MAKKLKMFLEVKYLGACTDMLTKQNEIAPFFLHFIFFKVIPHKECSLLRNEKPFLLHASD